MDSKKEINENKIKDVLEEAEENTIMCIIIKTLSDVYIRYDVSDKFFKASDYEFKFSLRNKEIPT